MRTLEFCAALLHLSAARAISLATRSAPAGLVPNATEQRGNASGLVKGKEPSLSDIVKPSAQGHEVGRVLLYVTSYDKAEHLQSLQSCWPALLRRSRLLANASLLLYLDGTIAQMEAWKTAARALNNGRVVTASAGSPDHGYQPGAMYALWVAINQKWFQGYDWVCTPRSLGLTVECTRPVFRGALSPPRHR